MTSPSPHPDRPSAIANLHSQIPPDSPCPFCSRIASGEAHAANEAGVAFPDAHPVSPGHTLVVPRRHEPDFFRLSADEQSALWDLARKVRDRLAREHNPDGFNLGLNAGAAAGQTVGHAHIHVIPRHDGDVKDPRGGVRWVVPGKARYWTS